MVSVSNIAQRVLDENNYTTSDISIANLEYLIDNAVDYINLMAGTSIADLGGTSPNKTLAGTENEIILTKTLSALMIRAYKDRGPNAAISGVSVTSVLADPQYELFSKIVENGIAQLKVKQSVPFVVATDDS